MEKLLEKEIVCPYCGEYITILIDTSVAQQNYIEDCQVCCRPIIVDVQISHDGETSVNISNEDE